MAKRNIKGELSEKKIPEPDLVRSTVRQDASERSYIKSLRILTPDHHQGMKLQSFEKSFPIGPFDQCWIFEFMS